MTRVVKLKVPYIEKHWNPIPNKPNVEWWNWKKNNNCIKGFKTKIKIKIMIIKIEIKK
jgi:hypothetical protein